MLPRATQWLILLNVAVFALQMVTGDVLVGSLALWPVGSYFRPWQLVTYAFMHASVAHVAFNMLGLYMFGADLERVWGQQRFLVYYFACVVSAGLAQLALTSMTGQLYPTIGASGGVFGLLLAFALYFPDRIIVPLFPPIPMPAWLFAIVYGAIELGLGVSGRQAGVAHFAHLGGMLGGFLIIRFAWGRRLWRRWPH